MTETETSALSGETQTEDQDVVQMVGFVLAGELFGVDILMVQEIIKEIPVTIIPDSPEFIEGVINLRGNILPVIDLHKRLSMQRPKTTDGQEGRTIILDIGGRITGFLVDRVTRVIKVPENAIKPAPEMVLSALKSKYISGVFKFEDNLMTILDFNRILVVDEIKRLSAQKRRQQV